MGRWLGDFLWVGRLGQGAVGSTRESDMAGQFWRAGLLGPSIEQLEPRLLLDGLGLVQSLAEGSSYYVNLAIDADFGDNEYTTAAGNDANDGLSSATP